MRTAITMLATASAVIGCGAQDPQVHVEPPAPVERLCQAPLPESYGVSPLHNKTNHRMELEGTDDLITSAMSDSQCFMLVERDKVTLLVDEMKLCDDDNKDKQYFNCQSFAQKGQIYGVKRMVMGDVIFFEQNVKGAELNVKVPGIGGLELGESYAAVALSLRVVDVQSGKVLASTVVHAAVPSSKAGIDASGSGFNLKVAAHADSPMGKSLQAMLTESVRRMRDGLSANAGGS